MFIKKILNKKINRGFSLLEISITLVVIGILIVGISQSFELISEASLRSARNLTKSSRIIRIDELTLWLDATNEKAFDKSKSDNSIISIWKDSNPKSNFSVSTNSSSTSFSPIYLSTIINDLPGIKFTKTSSSVGNCLTISNDSFINSSEDFTLYLIFSPNTLDDGVIIEKNNSTATSFPFSLELTGGTYKFSIKNSSSTLSVYGAKNAKIKTPNLIRLSRVKGSQIEIMINDVSASQSDTFTSSTLNNSELSIGCRNGASPSNFINGNIGEIAFFDRNLNTKEKNEIEEYFYKKWKMKKYEGVLAVPELPCQVPSSLNLDTSITLVQSTNSPKSIGCKSNYSGTPNYTCINGVFALSSGSCLINGCMVSNCVTQYFPGSTSLSQCLNLSSIIGSTVNYGSINTNYFSDSGISHSVRWRCNNDGTMDVDTKQNCYNYSTLTYCFSRNHSQRCNQTNYINESIVTFGNYFCCNGIFVRGSSPNNSPCPWSF